jgi:hypothetical protein
LTEIVKLVFDVLAVKLPVGERFSQLLVVQVCSDAWAVALVLTWAVTVSICEGGATPPATAVNVNVVGLRVRVGAAAAVTVRVTLKTSDPWLEFI